MSHRLNLSMMYLCTLVMCLVISGGFADDHRDSFKEMVSDFVAVLGRKLEEIDIIQSRMDTLDERLNSFISKMENKKANVEEMSLLFAEKEYVRKVEDTLLKKIDEFEKSATTRMEEMTIQLEHINRTKDDSDKDTKVMQQLEHIEQDVEYKLKEIASEIAGLNQSVNKEMTKERLNQTDNSKFEMIMGNLNDLKLVGVNNKRDIDGLQTQIQYTEKTIAEARDRGRISFTAELRKTLKNLPKGTTLILDHVFHNDGQGYDGSTGIFTCPETGVYLFVFFIKPISSSSISSINIGLYVNGVLKVNAVCETYHEKQDLQGGNSVVAHVNKGEQVLLATYNQEALRSMRQNIYPYFTTFTGAKLYDSY